MTTTVNEPAERLREWMLNGDGRMWVPDLDAALAAERAIGAEALDALETLYLPTAMAFEHSLGWKPILDKAEKALVAARRLTRERNGQ